MAFNIQEASYHAAAAASAGADFAAADEKKYGTITTACEIDTTAEASTRPRRRSVIDDGIQRVDAGDGDSLFA